MSMLVPWSHPLSDRRTWNDVKVMRPRCWEHRHALLQPLMSAIMQMMHARGWTSDAVVCYLSCLSIQFGCSPGGRATRRCLCGNNDATMPTPTLRSAPDNTPRQARAAMQDTTPRPQPYTRLSGPREDWKFIMNLFVRELIVVLCSAFLALPSQGPEPQVGRALVSSPDPHQHSKRKRGLVNIVQHFCTSTEFRWHISDWLMWQLSHLYWASLPQTT